MPVNAYDALVPDPRAARPCLLLDDGASWSYADLDDRSAALAGALHHRDVGAAERSSRSA